MDEAAIPVTLDATDDTATDDTMADILDLDNHNTFIFAKPGTVQFANWCIKGSVTQATNCLVQQSLLQVPVSLYLDPSAQLTINTIQLFLHIAKMLVTTGQTHHTILAHIIGMLLELIPTSQQAWPTMPSTLEGFYSHILNPTNKNALVTLLPVPTAYMLHDSFHAYCWLQEIATFVLLLSPTRGVAPVPL
jgi:hypothetical protein